MKLSAEARALLANLHPGALRVLESKGPIWDDGLREMSAAMLQLTNVAVREGRGITATEKEVWQALSTAVHDNEIDPRYMYRGADGALHYMGRVAYGADGRAVGSPSATQGRESGWVDREGRPVCVLRSGGSFAEAVRREEDQEWGELTLGSFVRAMVSGPRTPLERRALSEGTGSAGGYAVPTPLAAQVIDRLRAQAVCLRAGALTVPMPSGTLSIAKLTGDAATAWHVENATETAGDATFGQVTLTARTLLSLVRASRELLEDSANINTALATMFANSLALELDRVALFGTGSAPQPQGLRTLANVNETSMGTNGGQIADWSKLLTIRQQLANANAGDPTAFVMAPRTFYKLQGFVDTLGQPLRPPAVIAENAVPYLVTTACPITETQGSASTASTVFLGDFAQMLLGMRAELRIELLKERYADSYQYGLLASLRADVAVTHAESFARLIGIIP